MIRFTRFTLSVFLLVILTAGTCAAVTVPGHDGTELALSEIGDIIRHVTGQTEGELSFRKESLLVHLLNGTPNSGYEIQFKVLGFDGQGNHSIAGTDDTHTDNAAYCDVLDDDKAYYSQKIHMLTAPHDDPNGIEVAPAVKFDDGGYDVTVWSPTTDSDGNTSLFVQDGWGADSLRNTLSLPALPIEIENGMTVSGDDGYISAVLVREIPGDPGSHLYLYFAKISGDAYDAVKIPCDYSQTIPNDSLPMFSSGEGFFPASIAAGDFDNDGYRNELALTWSDIDHVYARVVQLSYDTGSKQYSLREIYSSTVHDYEYSSIGIDRNRGKDMDGAGTMYSASVAAGNFDGVPGDEFAVVFRDNKPDRADKIYKTHVENYYGNGNLGYINTAPFEGLTGGINVVTHKWNGSTFQTASARKTYDSYRADNSRWSKDDEDDFTCTLFVYYYFPVAARAIVADMDGDGRDEVVVQRMSFNFCDDSTVYPDHHEDHSFREFTVETNIDVWDFDGGSIQPDPVSSFTAASSTYKGGVGTQPVYGERDVLGYDEYGYAIHYWPFTRSMFIKMVSRAETPYPFFEREFDIIAGKFTGRIGTVVTADDLVIKHPVINTDDSVKLDGNNYVRSAVSLVKDYDGKKANTQEITDISKPDGTNYIPRDYAVGFMTADFLAESVTLGEPVKTADRSDLDYTAILQMMPYHVDNIKPDGSALTEQPQNFTLLMDTKIEYSNTSTSADKSSMSYGMTTTAETIFALDSSLTRGASSAFQGIRGITSTFLGETPAGKKIEAVGKVWDKLKDTITTTKSTSNEHEKGHIMTIATQANYLDTLYVNTSNRYIWRYPLDNPPDWVLGQTLGKYGSFDVSKAERKQTYITFAMSEPAIPTAVKGVNDTHYQPYHESGNLFSYPASLEQVEGYKGHTSLLGKDSNVTNRWEGVRIQEAITLTDTTTNQESTQKTNKAGAVTKFLSVIDNIFGSNFAHIPYDTTSSFTRNVTSKESITVDIPPALSGAQFTAVFEPYLDVTGAMTVAFAVESFREIDALWGQDSLYSKKPDPSFLLPEKFHCTSLPQVNNQYFAAFSGNDNDATAIRGRGIRYTASEYDIESSNLLMNGVKYKIKIPVYNASFVDTQKAFKVRLSYSKELKYNTTKTTIAEHTFTTFSGQGSRGNHRQFAEFEWTPNIDQGIYYLYAEIDPDHAIDEVHEDRRDASGKIIDYGGNNMAYFKIGITNTDTVPFDRTQLETQYTRATSAGKFAAADLDPSDFPYVEWVKVDGMDFRDFIEQKVDGQTQPVTAEVEVKYSGEYLMTDAAIIGYALKPESSGKDVTEITDADIGLVFVKEHFAMFPEEDHKLHFRINPNDLLNGVGFVLQVYGQEYPLTDIIYGSAGSESSGVGSSSSSGCSAGLGVMAGIVALGFVLMKRR